MINGRVHFKKGKGDDALGIWWNGSASWTIGYDNDKGSKNCFGFFIQDVLCPHQIEEWNGKLFHGEGIGLRDAGEALAIQCSIRGNVIFESRSNFYLVMGSGTRKPGGKPDFFIPEPDSNPRNSSRT